MTFSKKEKKYLETHLHDKDGHVIYKEWVEEGEGFEPTENDLVITPEYQRILEHRIREKIKRMKEDLKLARKVYESFNREDEPAREFWLDRVME